MEKLNMRVKNVLGKDIFQGGVKMNNDALEIGSKEIYIADTVVYEINDNGKTVDTYYP
jgi:hypothetical protein